MKKMYVFLCVALVLFLGSCSDLSVNDEEALAADLPADFDWQEYARINNDVKMSQIIIDIREKNKEYGKGTDSTSKAKENCVNIIKDEDFAKNVYLEYMQCPENGWNPKEKCTGKYAYNGNFTKTTISGTDTTRTCTIIGCWSGGWSELLAGWQDSLTAYSAASYTAGGSVDAMCQFIPKAENAGEVQKYLNDFNFDAYLIEQHYHFFGRMDGRPYKKCDSGSCEERSQSLHGEKRAGLNYSYYDYSKYTFCVNDEEKICVVK